MMQFMGKIRQVSGQAIIPKASGKCDIKKGPEGKDYWSGEFVYPQEVGLPGGGPYELVFENGTSCVIFVTGVDFYANSPSVARFFIIDGAPT